jgi:hypothetical protein
MGDDGKHRPYGLMVLQIEGDLIAGSSASRIHGCSNNAACRRN